MSNKTQTEPQAYDIHIIGRNIAVTESMKEYAREKISKTEQLSNRIIDVYVTMDITREEHHVNIVMSVEHTKIKVGATTTDMYASVEMACDRLQRKLRRYRSRLQDHHAKKLSVVDMNVHVIGAEGSVEDEVNDAIVEENLREAEQVLKPHEIVSRETKPLKTLTPEEAIMKMELSDDRFMIYRSEVDQKLKVIYRRNDGHYGIIEPE